MSCDMLYLSCDILVHIAGPDYTSTVMELVLSGAVCRHVVKVPITQDSFSELPEQFSASLSLVENNGINVVVNPDPAIVTVFEDSNGELMH